MTAWKRRTSCSLFALGVAAAQIARTAAAQDAQVEESPEAIEARKLFLEGRAMFDRGEPEACEMLERSHKLVPTLATLLNLGLCHSYAGRLATAHDCYREAEALAALKRDMRRRDFAHDQAAALAPRRAVLTLRIPETPDMQLEVRIDGVLQSREAWTAPIYLDAGEHLVSVDALDQQSWSGSVAVVDGRSHVLVVPEFQRPTIQPAVVNENVAAAEPGVPQTAPTAAVVDRAPAGGGAGLSTSRVAALSVGGAGVVALGVSLAYTIAARSAFDDSNEFCDTNDDGEDVCTSRGLQRREDAVGHAARATAFGVAGGAALIGAAVWWFLATPGDSAPGGESVSVRADSVTITAQIRGVF